MKSFFGYLSNLCKMNKQPTFAHTRTWTLHDKNIIWRVTRIRILPCTRVTLPTYVCVKTAGPCAGRSPRGEIEAPDSWPDGARALLLSIALLTRRDGCDELHAASPGCLECHGHAAAACQRGRGHCAHRTAEHVERPDLLRAARPTNLLPALYV